MPGEHRERRAQVARLEGELKEEAAGQAPEGDVLGEHDVGVAQDEDHAVLVGRVLDHPDLIRHNGRPVVARGHLRRRRRCTRRDLLRPMRVSIWKKALYSSIWKKALYSIQGCHLCCKVHLWLDQACRAQDRAAASRK